MNNNINNNNIIINLTLKQEKSAITNKEKEKLNKKNIYEKK